MASCRWLDSRNELWQAADEVPQHRAKLAHSLLMHLYSTQHSVIVCTNMHAGSRRVPLVRGGPPLPTAMSSTVNAGRMGAPARRCSALLCCSAPATLLLLSRGAMNLSSNRLAVAGAMLHQLWTKPACGVSGGLTPQLRCVMPPTHAASPRKPRLQVVCMCLVQSCGSWTLKLKSC